MNPEAAPLSSERGSSRRRRGGNATGTGAGTGDLSANQGANQGGRGGNGGGRGRAGGRGRGRGGRGSERRESGEDRPVGNNRLALVPSIVRLSSGGQTRRNEQSANEAKEGETPRPGEPEGGRGGRRRGRRGGRGRARPTAQPNQAPRDPSPPPTPQVDYKAQWTAAFDSCKQRELSNLIDDALDYLQILTDTLRAAPKERWNEEIYFPPPPPPEGNAIAGNHAQTPGGVGAPSAAGGNSRPNPHAHQTIFDLLGDQEDGSDDGNGVDDDEADAMSTNRYEQRQEQQQQQRRGNRRNRRRQRQAPPPPTPPIPLERKVFYIMIEFFAYFGELLAAKAGTTRRNREVTWTAGANFFTRSSASLREAMDVLNSQVNYAEVDGAVVMQSASHPELIGIADSISIPTENSERRLVEFQEAAELQQVRILNRLNPQLRERDEVKSRWGEEAWTTNPEPKMDYAARRRALEEELRDLEVALHELGVTRNKYEDLQSEVAAFIAAFSA